MSVSIDKLEAMEKHALMKEKARRFYKKVANTINYTRMFPDRDYEEENLWFFLELEKHQNKAFRYNTKTKNE